MDIIQPISVLEDLKITEATVQDLREQIKGAHIQKKNASSILDDDRIKDKLFKYDGKLHSIIYFLEASIYYELDDIQQCYQCIDKSIVAFSKIGTPLIPIEYQNTQWNKMLIQWTCGEILIKLEVKPSALKKFNEAIITFEDLVEWFQDEGKSEKHEKYKILLKKFKIRKKQIEYSQDNTNQLFFRKESLSKKTEAIQETFLEPEGQAVVPEKMSKENTIHITIPVDMQTLERSSITSKDFEKLIAYNQKTTRDTQKHIPLPSNSQCFIPSFPVYGAVAANPTGEPFLNQMDIEYMNAFDNNLKANLDGDEYKLYPTKKNDQQITISKEKEYGWLKVKGNSMNKSYATPIDDQDYVLYYKSSILKSCLQKIVVASHIDPASQTPQLVIKRLTQKKGEYILRSESSSNYADIELIDNNQIIGVVIGEVIAVAKPIII